MNDQCSYDVIAVSDFEQRNTPITSVTVAAVPDGAKISIEAILPLDGDLPQDAESREQRFRHSMVQIEAALPGLLLPMMYLRRRLSG
jgi:hypothetical protein